MREKVKDKWFVCVRNEDMKMLMLILGAFRACNWLFMVVDVLMTML